MSSQKRKTVGAGNAGPARCFLQGEHRGRLSERMHRFVYLIGNSIHASNEQRDNMGDAREVLVEISITVTFKRLRLWR